MARYIDADKAKHEFNIGFGSVSHAVIANKIIDSIPTADVVEVDKYNELREDFIDFVCSGVHNPAPYCKNRCSECVDSSGWCTYRRCTGFNPDGERRTDNDL